MKNLNLRRFLFILLCISGLAWFVVADVTGLDTKKVVDFLCPIPTVVTIDLLICAGFAKWFWRWKWLQGWLVPFPDLNGTWQGHLETDWKDKAGKPPGPIHVMLTIQQTFGRISCVMRSAEMDSHSYVEGFCIDMEAQVRRLCYSYTSRPKVKLRDRSTPHDGTFLFRIIDKPIRKLEGEYWTQRGTGGTVTLLFESKELREELPTGFPSHPIASAGQIS